MDPIRYYLGPFTNNNAFRLFHDDRLATPGKHAIRLPDRTLVWSDEYEQRLQEYESKTKYNGGPERTEPRP